MNTWNLVAPRIGASFALTSDNRTVLKANYGQYWWNPGAALSQDVNPNPETWNRRYVWNDLNGDLVWQRGEEGRLNSSAGGVTSVLLAENLQDTYTQEVALWLEREVMTNFGVRTGAVWRGERQLAMSFNANRPYSAFNVPITVQDPGPDGVRGNADDGASIAAFNLAAENLALPVLNTYDNVPGDVRLLHLGGDGHQAYEQSMVGNVLVHAHLERRRRRRITSARSSGRTTCRSRRTTSSTPSRTARSSTPTGR